MTSWRPEGWENPYTYHNLEAKPMYTGIDFANVPTMAAFEAGADAMLKELRTLHTIGKVENGVYSWVEFDKKDGSLVFIPDDTKKGN